MSCSMAAILVLSTHLLTVPATSSHNIPSSCLEAAGQVSRGRVAAMAMQRTTSVGASARLDTWTASSERSGTLRSSRGGRVVTRCRAAISVWATNTTSLTSL